MAKDSVTFRDLYQYYPYKKNIEGVVIQPYVKKSECTNTPESLNFYEYRKILSVYFKYLIQYFLQGGIFEMPHSKLGRLHLYKYRAPGIIAKRFNEKYIIDNIHSSKYRVILKWDKKNYPIPNAAFWKVKINFGKELYTKLTQEPESIFNIL